MNSERLRIDKWLWAARFFKTRSLASDAVDGGKVLVGGSRVKPGKAVQLGEMLSIRVGAVEYRVEVLALSDKRGPAASAQLLYRETEESKQSRENLAAQRLAQPEPARKGRPSKRDRRAIEKLTGRK